MTACNDPQGSTKKDLHESVLFLSSDDINTDTTYSVINTLCIFSMPFATGELRNTLQAFHPTGDLSVH